MAMRLVRLTGQDCPVWLGPALHIYVAAMEYPRGTENNRVALWREHIARPGWTAYAVIHTPAVDTPTQGHPSPPADPRRLIRAPIARSANESMVGIAYGYRGAEDQWWNQQLRTGLRLTGHSSAEIAEIATGYFELTELHVHPDAQGHGIGQWLLRALLADRPESHVLLSTPEIPAERNRAWALYRRMGFVDVLRHFTFTGDPRPFAFLGRALPLQEQPVPYPPAPYPPVLHPERAAYPPADPSTSHRR
ncbi:MAG: N-acetyltransferase [Gordonia sp. (in: high G+C Gram-positive bacteria)]